MKKVQPIKTTNKKKTENWYSVNNWVKPIFLVYISSKYMNKKYFVKNLAMFNNTKIGINKQYCKKNFD